MDNEGIIVGDVSAMLTLEARVKSFQRTSMVDGKKFRWRYTLIPYDAMARLGFFYCPSRDPTTGKIHKDAVACIYCRRVTHDFRECRSKKKDVMETLKGVLRKHLETHSPRCLLSYMKLKILDDVLNGKDCVDLNEDEFFHDPMQESVQGLFQFTFAGNWHHSSKKLDPEQMAKAGLVRYDSSFTGFEELLGERNNDASYCIYCKKILAHWQPEDSPLREHYKSSNGGQCFFISKLDKNTMDSLQHNVRTTDVGNLKDSGNKAEISVSGSESDGISSNPSSPHDSPVRRKRKLKRNFTQLTSEGEFDSDPSFRLEDDKDLVLDFKSHKQRADEVGRKNPILDDSKDEFSFSALGHSTFDIPPPPSTSKNTVRPITISENTSKTQSHPMDYPETHHQSNLFKAKKPLDDIPIDVTLSSDSSSEVKSGQVQNLELANRKSSPLENTPGRPTPRGIRSLSPLQWRKSC